VGCEARKIPADAGVFFLDFYLYRTYQAVGATHANFGIAAHPCNALSAGPDQVHSGVMTVIFASW
jgi:hypothetical protein